MFFAFVSAVFIASILIFFANSMKKTEIESGRREKSPEEKYLKNTELLEAIENYRYASKELNYYLKTTSFLAIAKTEDVEGKELSENPFIFKDGTAIKFKNCYMKDDDFPLFPVFTDKNKIKGFTEDEVSSFILSAKDVYKFVNKQKDKFLGIVINPKTTNWIMSQEDINPFVSANNQSFCSEEIIALISEKFEEEDLTMQSEEAIFNSAFLLGTFSPEDKDIDEVFLEITNWLKNEFSARGYEITQKDFAKCESQKSYPYILESVLPNIKEAMERYNLDFEEQLDTCIRVVTSIILKANRNINESFEIAICGLREGILSIS